MLLYLIIQECLEYYGALVKMVKERTKKATRNMILVILQIMYNMLLTI